MKLFGHYVYPPIVLLAAIEFIVANLSFWLVAIGLERAGYVSAHPAWAIAFGAAVTLGLTAVGLYQSKQRLRIEGVLARVVVGLGIAATVLALFALFFSVRISGAIWALSFATSMLLLGITRVILWKWVDHDALKRNVLIYGAGRRAGSLLKLRRRSDRRGFNITAFVPAVGDETRIDDPRVITLEGSLHEYATKNGVDEIVVAMDDRRQGFPISELLECRFSGLSVVDLLGFLERETGKLVVDILNPSWLIFSDGFEVPMTLRIVTRALDFGVALLLLVIGSPFLLIVAIVIAIDDGWPVIYRQRRVGRAGKTFTLFKFRSMIKDAEADGKARWAGAGDARVTRVGRIIRKLRLDELPQLFNVLAGDMSLVGPRPERPEFVERLSQKLPYYHERHTVNPGITGWAQLCYPYGSSDDDALEKLQYDLYYIKHKSVTFDLIVLLQTAEVVLWGKGAR